jgi:peptidoglycan/LPS O-acetylase OafA/YrhL
MANILKIELNPNRIFGLDILRAFAILFVVIGHGSELLPQKAKLFSGFFIFDGVALFFVLSGFLIGGILINILDKNEISGKILFDFWIRRWFRTLPNYFLVLIVLAFLQFFFTDNFSFTGIGSYFIFSQNLATPHPDWFFPEAWSLSVEEWFYLLVPVIIFLLIKIFRLSARMSVLFTAFLIIALVTGFRLTRFESAGIANLNEWDLFFRKQVFTRLDSLMYGVIGAYLHFYYKVGWFRYKNALMIIGLFIFAASKLILPKFFDIQSLYSCVLSFSVASFATLCLLPFLSDLKSGKGFVYKVITYTSLISYSMYLLNLSVVQRWILDNINWNPVTSNGYAIVLLNYSIFWILTVVLSILLYKYFEIPMTKLRDSKKIKSKAVIEIPITNDHERAPKTSA